MERRSVFRGVSRRILLFFTFVIFLSATFNTSLCKAETEDELLARKNENCQRLLIQFLAANRHHLPQITDNLLVKLFGPHTLNPKQKVRTLKFVDIQSQNLYLTRGKWERVFNPTLGKEEWVQISHPRDKSRSHTARQAKLILDYNADIAVIHEVEGIGSALRLNQEFLGNQYIPISAPGNDPRELISVFLVKAGLPLKVSFDSHAHRTRPIQVLGTSVEQPILTRDLIFLLLSSLDAPDESPPKLILGAGHLRSQRSSPSDPGGVLKRGGEIDLIVQVFNEYKSKFGSDVAYALIADFNASLWKDATLQRLFTELNFKDALRILNPAATESDLITHVYFPTEYQRVSQQMDGILVSPHLEQHIMSGGIHRWPDENGVPVQIPDTMVERNKNPSDHFPIYTEINVEHLF